VRQHRAKIFISNGSIRRYGRELDNLISEAFDAIGIVSSSSLSCADRDGVYIYISHLLCPWVPEGDITPEVKLMLSASEGWKLI